MKIYRKFKKLINNPEIFFRDYLNKKHPITNTELNVDEAIESAFVQYSELNTVSSSDMLVDIVYTWVDNTDKAWQKKYQQYIETNNSNIGQYATDIARFSNHNELFYSITSVKKYLPWVRNIYIVTDNQTPQWIDKFDNIIIIDHKEIIDERYLPTFNSHVIEAFLYKIPNLAENFIYFNDDVFVAKQLPQEHFFTANNIASLFVSNKDLYKMQKKGVITPTLQASLYAIELLNNYYPLAIKSPLVHSYLPLKKSAYEKTWDLFANEIRKFLPNKFRGTQDLNLASFLVPWLMYAEGQAVEKIDVCYYFNIRSRHALTRYEKLLKLKKLNASPHSFCANDFNSELKNPVTDYQEKLIKMLKNYYQ